MKFIYDELWNHPVAWIEKNFPDGEPMPEHPFVKKDQSMMDLSDLPLKDSSRIFVIEIRQDAGIPMIYVRHPAFLTEAEENAVSAFIGTLYPSIGHVITVGNPTGERLQ